MIDFEREIRMGGYRIGDPSPENTPDSLVVQYTAEALSRGQLLPFPERNHTYNAIVAYSANEIIRDGEIGPVSMGIWVVDSESEEGRILQEHMLTDVSIVGFVQGDGVDRAMIKGDWYLGINENGVRWPVPVESVGSISSVESV
jgi:hypothetical protein